MVAATQTAPTPGTLRMISGALGSTAFFLQPYEAGKATEGMGEKNHGKTRVSVLGYMINMGKDMWNFKEIMGKHVKAGSKLGILKDLTSKDEVFINEKR